MTENRKQLVEFAHGCATAAMADGADVFEADCKIVEHLLDFCEITVPEENRFFVRVNCGGIQHSVIRLRDILHILEPLDVRLDHLTTCSRTSS